METRTIKDLVLEENALTAVFEKYGIDYCCGGNLTLESACVKKGLDLPIVARAVEKVQLGRPYSAVHSDLWNLDFLVDFIVQNHHRYCAETGPVILTQLAKLETKHGERYPYITQVRMLFHSAVHELEQHTRKEEMILFPYIKSLVSAKDIGRAKPSAPFASLLMPISRMEEEHASVGETFFKIRALLNDYNIPEGDCTTHRSAIKGLEEFERDLHQHIHLENNLLFPRSIQLEEGIVKFGS